MTEQQVGFLCNIAATLSKPGTSVCNTLLRSYYLMRCKDRTKGYGLPDRHFSSKVRCPNCCLEWKNTTEIKVRSIKKSKKQRRRLKTEKESQNRKESISQSDNLKSNEVEQICSFCSKSTISTHLKPTHMKKIRNIVPSTEPKVEEFNPAYVNNERNIKTEKSKVNKDLKHAAKRKLQSNVYSNALDIFSLQNQNNTLASTIKEKPKVINNNKKKKDKFAGLCQKAVLASAKLKEQKKDKNNLKLFLKPST